MSRTIAAAAVLSLTLSLSACCCPQKAAPKAAPKAEAKPMAMAQPQEHHAMVEVRHAEPAKAPVAMHAEPQGCMAGCPCYEDESDRDMGRLRDRQKRIVCCGHDDCTGCGSH